MIGLEIRPGPALSEVKRLLDGASLPSADLEAPMLGHFLAGYSGGGLNGVVGLELYGSDGLLRSLVVEPAARGTGLGRALVSEIETRAYAAGVGTLYLLTTTARDYFHRLGYRDCDRRRAPDSIRASREFSSLCPGTAAFMRKRLGPHGEADRA